MKTKTRGIKNKTSHSVKIRLNSGLVPLLNFSEKILKAPKASLLVDGLQASIEVGLGDSLHLKA